MGIFIYGLAVGAVLVLLEMYVRRNDIVVTWYDRVIGLFGVLLVLLGVWHYFGSLAEFYTFAGLLGLIIFGGLGLVLSAIAFSLIWRRRGKAA